MTSADLILRRYVCLPGLECIPRRNVVQDSLKACSLGGEPWSMLRDAQVNGDSLGLPACRSGHLGRTESHQEGRQATKSKDRVLTAV